MDDYDKDGVRNIDDPFPFDSSHSKWPKIEKQPRYYQRARYGGLDLKFSNVLMNIENHNNQHSKGVQNIVRSNKNSVGRIKTIPSTINKLAETGLMDIGDIAGVKILTKDRKQAYDKMLEVKQQFRTNPKYYDDFYKKPKNKVYYGLHAEVLNPFPTEVQVKSRKMDALSIKTHLLYKRHQDMTKYVKIGKHLFNLGF
jgi:(p)ppGpp synthase/HD superfamily hydrolase